MMFEQLVQNVLQQLQQPKKDIEQNVRALLSEAISKMDLVTRDELERHQQALINANNKLAELQQQLEELQQQNKD